MTGIAQRLNVLGGPLQICSTSPITGWLRNGYCDSVPSDGGKHYLAAEVTDEFLDYSAKQGNDLRQGMQQPDGTKTGLSGGCKWCLCVTRWKEAFMARDTLGDSVVPKVLLESTHKDTLDHGISIEDLTKFAFKQESTSSP